MFESVRRGRWHVNQACIVFKLRQQQCEHQRKFIWTFNIVSINFCQKTSSVRENKISFYALTISSIFFFVSKASLFFLLLITWEIQFGDRQLAKKQWQMQFKNVKINIFLSPDNERIMKKVISNSRNCYSLIQNSMTARSKRKNVQ